MATPDLTLVLPLSADARREAIASMVAGRVRHIRIGQCDLTIDADGEFVWGCDAYGQDRIAASAANAGADMFSRAIDWAIAEEQRPDGDHPAERCYDNQHGA